MLEYSLFLHICSVMPVYYCLYFNIFVHFDEERAFFGLCTVICFKTVLDLYPYCMSTSLANV